MASTPFCHVVRTQTLSYWAATTRLSIVAPAYRFAIGHPLLFTGLLLATHDSTGLAPLTPTLCWVDTYLHALMRRYCVVAIRHVSGEREFVPLRPSDISNLALAELASCYCSPHLLKVGACGLAPSLGACSSQTSIFFNLHTVLLFYQSLQRYATCAIHQSTRPAHRSLVYSDRHLYSVYFQSIGGSH